MIEAAETPARGRPGRYAIRCLFGFLALLAIGTIALLLIRTPAEEAFRWFSSLGFPDVKGRKFIRVATGHWSQVADDAPTNQYIDGFLLSESNGSFVVLTKDLLVRSFTNSPVGTAPHKQVSYESLSLAAETSAYLRLLEDPPNDYRPRLGQRLPERVEVFVLAWACARNGESVLSKKLFEQASVRCEGVTARTNWWGNFRERIDTALHRSPKVTLVQQVERDLGHLLMWRAIEGFEEPAVTRKELLQQLQTIIENYPGSEHVQRAKATAEILERMNKEDETHRSPETSLDALPVEQKVAELIFHLRDQNGRQFSQPGSCDIFMYYSGTTNTPAHELVRVGYAAVPQLIDAIDDPTLTRSVSYHRRFYFSHTVLTVGDCAITILWRITGKSFYVPKTASNNPSSDGLVSPARKAARQWWADFQVKGEKRSLVDAVSSGDDDALAQAELLLARYPSDALEALAKGVRACSQEWTRTRLVELAGRATAPGVVNFLLEEMQNAPGLPTRVAAAQALRSKGERRSVAAMLNEWERFDDASKEDNDGEELIAFLAGTDSVEAINAVGRNLSKRKVQTRMEVVERLGRGSQPFEAGDEKLSPPTMTAIEAVLINALNDKEERFGMSGSWGDKSFTDPRVCDFAGHFLATRWPDRYTFDLSGLLRVRERQRVACQNVWRSARGFELLPLPSPRTTKVRAEDCTRVTLVEWEGESEAKASAWFKSTVAAINQQKLTATNFVELLTTFASAPGANISGIVLQARKDDDLTGVAIVVRLVPGRPPRPNGSLSVNRRVTVGRRDLGSSSGGGAFEHYASLKGWESFMEETTKALAAPANTPFVLNANLAADK